MPRNNLNLFKLWDSRTIKCQTGKNRNHKNTFEKIEAFAAV